MTYRFSACTQFQLQQANVAPRGTRKVLEIRNTQRYEQRHFIRAALLRGIEEPEADQP